VRWVLEGSFTYSKGNVASARVDTIAMVSEDPTNGNGDIITYGYGGILSFDGGISISNPQSASAWQNALSANPGRTIASYFLSNGEVTEGSKEPFANFGGGRFYQEGWTSNPFTSNLI